MYVPNLDTYIKSIELDRLEILTQMLEHKNPAFVLNCILQKLDKYKLLEQINYGEQINEAYDKTKLANGTGSGSLKKLVGASNNTKLSPAEWQTVGYKIARMSDFNRRDYVGMMNFLHVSCDLYTEIHKYLINYSKKKNNITESKKEDLGFTPNFYNSVNSIDDITKLISYALTKLSGIDCSDVEDEINNGDIDVDDVDEIADSMETDKEDDNTIDGEKREDFFNYFGSIQETKGYRGQVYVGQGGTVKQGKGPSDLVSIRADRGNGAGGLKEFVGIPKENDLKYTDLRRIAQKIIQNANPDECNRALGNVNFLGSACESFNNLKIGYLRGISKYKKGKKGYGKKAAVNNKINNNTANRSASKNKYKYPKIKK